MESRRKNPWLGLESYREGEVLYGRDDDIRDLTQCVLNDPDVLLYGKSGIGKSSILNAGVIPAMRRHGYLPVAVRLSHKDPRPYLEQIHAAIAAAIVPGGDAAAVAACIREEVPAREPGRESIYEYFHRHTFRDPAGRRLRILLIIDQFEEIFTLQPDEARKKAFFAQMADMLNDVMPAELQQTAAGLSEAVMPEDVSLEGEGEVSLDDIMGDLDLSAADIATDYVDDNDIRFVLTIREDFLSEFEYYTSAIPSLKQNRYGLRPINEEQAAQIILRPIPGLVTCEVARLIIEKVTGRDDFELDGVPEIEVDSAVLSLYLNRLYDASDGTSISAGLVEQKGGEIITDFYLEAISEISPSSAEFLEDHLLNGQGRRDNITVYDAMHRGGVTAAELDTLCDRRKILRRFNYAGDLRLEYVHDILCPVVKEHKDERLMLRAREEERRRQQEILAAEKDKRRELERKAREDRRRARRRMAAALAVLALLVGAFVFYYWYFESEHEAYYASFERVDGWPVGVGAELTAAGRQSMPLYYRLSRRGARGHYTDVEVCSSNPRLPAGPRIPLTGLSEPAPGDSVGGRFADLLSRATHIHFVEGEGRSIDKEVVSDAEGNVLFQTNYFHLGNGRDAWLQYVGQGGRNMAVTGSGIDRVKLTWYRDSLRPDDPRNGRVASMRFFDERGVNRPGADSISGYTFRRLPDGTVMRYALDEFATMKPARANVLITSPDGHTRSWARAITPSDTLPAAAPGPEGWVRESARGDSVLLYTAAGGDAAAVRVLTRDRRGNVLRAVTTGAVPPSVTPVVSNTYDEATGLLTSTERTRPDGTPFVTPADSIWRRTLRYDADGRTVAEERFYPGDRRVYLHEVESKGGVTVDRLADDLRGIYTTRVDTVRPDGSSVTAYYGRDMVPAEHSEMFQDYATRYHRKSQEHSSDGISLSRFYATDGTPNPVVVDKYGIVSSYPVREERRDADGNLLAFRLLDTDSRVLKSMMYIVQDGQTVGRAAMGIDGTPVRCPRWEAEGYGYYKLYYNKDFNDQFISVRPVDEWETGSVFIDDYAKAYQQIVYRDFKSEGYHIQKDRDYDGRIDFRTPYYGFVFEKATDISAASLPYLHILDHRSPLYAAGLRDGDRIVRLGAWREGGAADALAFEWERLRRGPLPMEILRPDGDSLRRISLDATLGTDELEEYHILRLSTAEKSRYDRQKSDLAR